MTILLALDPGGTTGFSLWQYGATEPLSHVTHGMVANGLHGWLHWWHTTYVELLVDEIVIEDFLLDGRTPKPDTTALEVIGAVEALASLHGTPVLRQRNVLKAHCPDEKLKEWGFWWPGKGHDRDSARHALASLKIARHRPTLERYWPRSATA